MKRILFLSVAAVTLFMIQGCYQYASDDSGSNNSDGMILENRRVCVSTRSSLGWSEPYIAEVSVMKGRLLNEKEEYTGYEDGGDYALVKGEDAVVKLERFYGTFTQQPVYGEDFRGRGWRFLSQYSCN